MPFKPPCFLPPVGHHWPHDTEVIKGSPHHFFLSLHVAVKVILHACNQKSCAPCSQLTVKMLSLLSKGNILITAFFKTVFQQLICRRSLTKRLTNAKPTSPLCAAVCTGRQLAQAGRANRLFFWTSRVQPDVISALIKTNWLLIECV